MRLPGFTGTPGWAKELAGTSAPAFVDHVAELNASIKKIGALSVPTWPAAKNFGLVSPEITRRLRATAMPPEKWRHLVQQLSELGSDLALLRRRIPPNLKDLDLDEQIQVVNLSIDTGFGAAGTFPADFLLRLVAEVVGNDADVRILLTDARTIAVQSCSESVIAIRDEGTQHDDHAVLLLRAIEALDANHAEASQALATVVWDSHIRKTVAKKGPITQMRQQSKSPQDLDIELAEFYLAAAWGPAIKSWQAAPSDSCYSRNGTVHDASASQLNVVNAICAITIAVGVIGHSHRFGDP